MQSIDQGAQKLVGILFPYIGLGLLLAAILSTVLTSRFINDASKLEGKVIRLNAGGAHPVIQFQPPGEQPVKFSGSGFINYAVGDSVTVLYLKDAQTPAGFHAKIDTPGALWDGSIALTLLGGGFIIGGLYTRYLYKPQKPNNLLQ